MNADRKHENKSAGIGDPYWYEWGIGLLKAVEMLNPDSGIDAVAFQKSGVKGWDDIVIQYRSGHQDYYQVKHSRLKNELGNNLTFSDLVAKNERGYSLLGSLSTAWHQMGLCGTDTTCILITNRRAGTKASRSKSGTFYPPLADFIEHLSMELETVRSPEGINVPDEWKDAWALWQSEIGDIPLDQKIQFLRAVTILTEAPQLHEIQDELAKTLSVSIGITTLQAEPLVQNLISALLKWTTSLRGTKEWVTAEDVMETLAVSEPEIFGYCDVPTPMPFFPSREAAVASLTGLLTCEAEHQVVFLEADPGSGKTSVVSRLVNQRADDYSTLLVDIRYYAYKPITPDSPVLPADADRTASPESLWYSLLSQVRERLRGRLLALRVPVRNHFITPDQARDHVLRLSGVLAQEKCAPFVIVIDGIDHAARARRKGLPSLLESLPAPELIPQGVRILIAGQPAAGYPEYPIWLRSRHELVVPIGLGVIECEDIRLLLSNSVTKIPEEDFEHASSVIQELAGGNTLAVVFSVAEAERCQTLDGLQERLTNRQIHSGVHAYYQAIWNAAIPPSPAGIAPYLSSVLCILRERVTGAIMHEAFSEWGKSAPEWNAILNLLEPLVIRDEKGFRVRHNDIRVFLERELRTDNTALRHVASLLADYYMRPSADPYFRQESVFTLLRLAGRTTELARIFNSAWVLDSAAYGRDLSTITQEAEDAFRAVPDLKDWDAALAVACGGLTLTKLSDCVDSFPDLLKCTETPQTALPQCLETERFVLPFNRWDDNTIRQIFSDAKMLSDKADINRARGLMEHWLSGISPMAVVAGVSGITDTFDIHGEASFAVGVDSLFEEWGRLAFWLGIPTYRAQPSESLEHKATYLFEKGWVTACIKAGDQEGAYTALKAFNPMYLSTLEEATEEASTKGMWELVGRLLGVLLDDRGRLNLGFRIKAAYWALKALGEEAAKDWLEVIPDAKKGQCDPGTIEMPLMFYVAKVVGWIEPQRDASAIASELAVVITSQKRHVRDRSSLLIPLRAASMIGLMERMLSKGNPSGAAALVPPTIIRSVIEFIWESRHSLDFHEYRNQALDLTFELIEQCQKVGKAHGEMVLSLSLLSAEKFPVDQCMPVLWEVLRRAGRRELLHKWAEHWIGEQGAVWSGISYAERAEIVDKLSHLARNEGWDVMSASAESRLRHHLIGYSSHKDYSFQEPLDWLEELTRSDPATWQREGVQLLDICRECDDQGGDNRLSSTIETEVAAAAFHCGSRGAWAFFNSIDPETERYWLQTVRNNLIAASKRVISDGTVTDRTDILALWSCSVGLTRWFDKYQAQAITELRDSILATVRPEGRDDLFNRMQSLTPGEVLREEYDRDRQRREQGEEREALLSINNTDVVDAVFALGRQVAVGHEPSLIEIAQLAIRVARENPVNRTELMNTLFGLVDANRKYGRGWDYWGEEPPLRELVPAIREHEVWELMRSAVRSLDDAFWFQSVSHNVHLICLFHAAGRGAEELKRGTQCVFSMHRLWSRLPERQQVDAPNRTVGNLVETWPCFAAFVLRRMLSADSAETVAAALRGLFALVEVVPEILPTVFGSCEARERAWLQFGMEVWSARYPKVAAPILGEMWAHADGELRTKIQLWVCKLMLSQVADGEKHTASFMPTPISKAEGHSTIFTKPQKLLEISPIAQGSTRLANAFSAARTWISRISTITGHDTNGLESKIAKAIIAENPVLDKSEKTDSRKHFAVQSGDMIITGGIDGILDEALMLEFRRPGWHEGNTADIAIAVTHGDDPWVVRRSPLPSPASFDWPDQRVVDEWIKSGKDNGNVLNRLRLLAKGDDLPEGRLVMGSCLRLFTSHHDFEMRYWLEYDGPVGGMAKRAPTCPSGRSFQFFLPGRFEPRADNSPLVFFSGSLLFLSFSTLEIIPARLLQERLEWVPSAENPFEWHRNGRLVAKYESYHGPLDYNRSQRHMRQPTLSRWVVIADEISEIPRLIPQWEHKTHSFSLD